MKFSEFCDIAENTEQEQQLLQFFKQDDMQEAEKVFAKLTYVPIVGKLFAAVIALGNYESIADFKQSEHYDHIKDWNFDVDFDKRSLNITPNNAQKKKALKVLAIIFTVIMLMVLFRKLRCRSKTF